MWSFVVRCGHMWSYVVKDSIWGKPLYVKFKSTAERSLIFFLLISHFKMHFYFDWKVWSNESWTFHGQKQQTNKFNWFTFNVMSFLSLVRFLPFVKFRNLGNLSMFFSLSTSNGKDDAFNILWTSLNVGVSIEKVASTFVMFINIFVNLVRHLSDFCSRSVASKINFSFIIVHLFKNILRENFFFSLL